MTISFRDCMRARASNRMDILAENCVRNKVINRNDIDHRVFDSILPFLQIALNQNAYKNKGDEK